LNPEDALSQLRDIHQPVTGGLWPPAPGWWLLALIAIALVAVILWLLYRRRQKSLWRRLAEAELNRLSAAAAPSPEWFSRLNTLLKQVSRECYPELHPETLSGEAWISFLLEQAPADRTASRPLVEAMVRSAWLPEASADPAQALAFARQWLGGQKC